MNNKVKFLRGTSDEYVATTKDSDTIYFTTDDGKLYIGDKEISGDGGLTIDDALSDTSTNPVQNKVVKQALDNKADKTVATTSADGLMSAEDKGKLDAFEITTTGGKLHDKDIVTTDLIPTTLPANGGNADTVDNLHASDFAKATNPSIEGEIHLLRSGNATTNGSLFAWEETVRIRNEDPNAENTTYTDFIVTPSGVFAEGFNNGNYIGREKLLTQSDIQTNIAGNTIFVKPNTNFPTINSAIVKAVSEQKSYTIYISDGTYIEDLDLRYIGNISLEFIGIGNVSVSSNTAYPQGALYCMSNCSFRNISFFASNSYAVHIEFNNAINSNGDYATYKNIRFENCVFGSGWTQCVGIGLGQGCTATFTNCVMQTSFYAHNQAKSNVSGQGIRLNGCQIYGGIQIDDAAYSNGFSNSVINIAVTNTSATEFVFVKDRSGSEWVTYNYIPNGDANVILDVVSGGNSYALNSLNNGFSVKKI